ncbi:MAG TPA: glycosyltransferase, partial [Mobilitalea sp.]|nr:glycosyltransferase [Mobilitalea sp.]
IFIFDGELYLQMKNVFKAETVYYLPLAVNVDRLDRLIDSNEDREKYSTEVSFVGNLYDKRNHYDEIPKLPEYLRGYFDGIMKSQMKIYGYNFIKEMISDDIMEELEKYISIRPGTNYVGDIKDIFADRFLNAKITGMERRRLLAMLSEVYDVNLYTDSDSSGLPKVHNKGYIDYYKVMPKTFRYSRINLNITLRTIKSGIPLRIFDVLGAGGFLITNYQGDIEKYFEIGKDLICYESEEDLLDKVQYYLQHEDERRQIAENGYLKVKQYHNYEVRLKEILRIVQDNGKATAHIEPEEAILGPDVNQLKQQLVSLIDTGMIDDAKTRYYTFKRSNPMAVLDQELSDYDMIFRIYSYENKREQHTLFDYSTDMNRVWEHYEHIRKYVIDLDKSGVDSSQEFIHYVAFYQVSYTAIEFIILEYAFDKVRLLNCVAWIFIQAGKNDLILPFLSLANELKPEDDDTLYHLAYILNQIGEYKMAYEYIDSIRIATPEALDLMEQILQKVAPIKLL